MQEVRDQINSFEYLNQVFRLEVDGDVPTLYRRAYIDKRGVHRREQQVKNKPNFGEGYCHVGLPLKVGNTSITLLYHRIICILWTKLEIPEGYFVDHKNGDRSDNRISNLRVGPVLDNNINQTKHREGKLPGISFRPHSGLWQARTKSNGVEKSLGYFKTKEAAAAAYQTFLRQRTALPINLRSGSFGTDRETCPAPDTTTMSTKTD